MTKPCSSRSIRAAIALSFAATALHAQGSVVLITDHALDGRGQPLTNARIGVAQGKITSLSASAATGATTIDLRGYTVMPGWIDTHVHLDSHFDRTGKIAGRGEPPAEATLAIANN